MSLPRNVHNAPITVPSHSSSPPKSSPVGVRGGTQNQTVGSTLLPSPHFDEPVTSASYDNPDGGLERLEQSAHTHDGSAVHAQPSHPFQPFFALIEDSLTHEHFHPTVHYIFADDEADIITEAALRSLEQSQSYPEGSMTSSTHPPEETQEPNSPDERYLPPADQDVREHYIVLDVEPCPAPQPPLPGAEASASGNVSAGGSTSSAMAGYEVTNVYSMSREWQVLRTGISQAPTLRDNNDEEALMLRIEGRGHTSIEQQSTGTMQEMIEKFQRGLEEVRGVMEAGGAARAGADLEGEAEETS